MAATPTAWAYAVAGVALISTVALGLARVVTGPARASAYAVAAATVLAAQSALFDASIQLLGRDHYGVFAYWQPYALIAASLLGLALVQQAYKAGPLPASLPVIDALLPIGAIGLGLGLFGETVNTHRWGLTGALVGLVLLVVSVVSLDTSTAVGKQQKIEDQHQHQHAEPDTGPVTG